MTPPKVSEREGLGGTSRAMPSARATAASRWSLLRVSSIAGISIALAGCHPPSRQQVAAWNAQHARDEQRRRYEEAFDHCIYRTTGPFSSASIDVIHYCEGRARAESGQ